MNQAVLKEFDIHQAEHNVKMAENTAAEKGGVHFASHDEKISPESSSDQPLHAVETITGLKGRREDLNPEAEQELQQLKTTLKNNMQSQRMQHHAFEPVSLPGSQPASRVSCIAPYMTRSLG